MESITSETGTFSNPTTSTSGTSSQSSDTTISVPPTGLSGSAIAEIVIGSVFGVSLLIVLALIIYKYRQRLLHTIGKDSRQSENRSVINTVINSRPNITYAPDHEYLTVSPFPSGGYSSSDESPTKADNY